LSKFEWSHLTEKVAYERRVREQKLRVEMMQAKRENSNFRDLVETGMKLDKIEERRRKREEKEGTTNDNFEARNVDDNEQERKKRRRRTRQIKPIDERKNASAKKPLLQAIFHE